MLPITMVMMVVQTATTRVLEKYCSTLSRVNTSMKLSRVNRVGKRIGGSAR